MYKDLNIDQLIKLSKANTKQIEIEMATFDKVYEEALKNVPEKDFDKMEKTKILCNKAINLAKEGKAIEAQNIINEIKNLK